MFDRAVSSLLAVTRHPARIPPRKVVSPPRPAARRGRVYLAALAVGGIVCATTACSSDANTTPAAASSEAGATSWTTDGWDQTSTRRDAAVDIGDAAGTTRGPTSPDPLDSGLESGLGSAVDTARGHDASLVDAGLLDADARPNDAGLEGNEAGAFPEAGAELDCEGLAPRYASGLHVIGTNGVRVTLVDAAPAPPVPGLNVFVLRIEDLEGNTIHGAELTVSEYMPQHHHGSPSEPVSEQLENGTYEVSGIEFTMPGYWEITIDVATGELEDTVRLDLCI